MDKMRRHDRLHTALVSIAVLGMLAPPSAHAAEGRAPMPTAAAPAGATSAAVNPAASEPMVIDVALQDVGVLSGHVVGQDGKCLAQQTVYVLRQGESVGTCQTDVAGRFVMTGLAGGVYEVRWAQGVTICRLWAPLTAPPSAKAELLLTADATVLRGQTGHPSPGSSLLKGPLPWVAAGVVITGLVWWDVVVAQKHRFDRDHPSAS
jgi:hypothetical protein